MWRPRPTKKINGTRSEKKIRIATGNRDPEARFLWTPALDSPRFNAIANQYLELKIKTKKEVRESARKRERYICIERERRNYRRILRNWK